MSEPQLPEDSPTERSPLLLADQSDDESTLSQRVFKEEMEEPWPATFERSIMLLASPIITAKEVDFVTHSPKPGLSMTGAAKWRNAYRGLERRFDTPEAPTKSALLRPGSKTMDDESFVKLKKAQSLDWSPATVIRKQHQQKTDEAKAYRQQLLLKANKGVQQHKKNIVEKEIETKATFSQCVFNMANILMGVGMLGLPFVFKSAGWIGGFFVSVGLGSVTWYTSILIGRQLNGDPRPAAFFDDSPYKSTLMPGSSSEARMRPFITSFPQIARESFGDRGNILLSSVLYFELFSCLCIFLVTLGTHLEKLFPTVSKEIHMAIMAGLLTLPTALLRTPRLLSYLSMVGTFATVCVVMAVLLSALVEGDMSAQVAESNGDKESPRMLWSTTGLPLALGLIAYTFSGHAIVPSLYASMERPQDFERMINCTFAIVMCCCLVVAVSGYYMFGNEVQDQITISLEESSSAVLAMECLTWLMILTAFSKFTLTMFPLAIGIEELVAPFLPHERAMELASGLIKLMLILASLGVAMFVPSFSFICALVGLICTMIVSVIFPAAAHLQLFGDTLSVSEIIMNWILIFLGGFVAVVGTIATI